MHSKNRNMNILVMASASLYANNLMVLTTKFICKLLLGASVLAGSIQPLWKSLGLNILTKYSTVNIQIS